MRIILSILLLFFSFSTFSQKISGSVKNELGESLSYASITIKGTSAGTSANNRALYSLNVLPGEYTLICHHIGYTSQERKIIISGDTELNFVLAEQKLIMSEVTIKSGGEDPAYAIIRQAIKKRNIYNNEVKAFSCDIYGKDILKLRKLPKKVFGQKITDESKEDMGLDSTGKGFLYLSESISTAYVQQPDKFKLEVKSSRVSGSESFGLTFPSFISLYNSNVKIFTERFNPRGFISPVADGAIGFYKFKFLGTFFEDGKAINSILVIPRRNYEPLFSGTINITDGDWRIHSFDLMLTKTSQLELIDTLRISQLHIPVSNEHWRTKNQLLHFNLKIFGIDMLGEFLSVYSNYNIRPAFDKKFFDRIVIKYDTAVNKRTIGYWDSARAVPLEAEEANDYIRKDSIYRRNKDSLQNRMSMDSLQKRQGKIKILPVIWSGIHRTHYSIKNFYSWGVNPLLFNSEFNSAEGIAVTLGGYYTRYLKKLKQNFTIEPYLRYGFNNKHFNPSVNLIFTSRNTNPESTYKQEEWIIGGGKRVSEYNKESIVFRIINTYRTLFDGHNYSKTYENYFGNISFSKRYESGFNFTVSSEFEDRIPLHNTTNYTFSQKDSINITPNYPFLIIAAPERHQAFIFSFDMSFRPGQRYIQLPKMKIPIGSKYPLFSINYTKGIKGIFNSDTDFDKWKFTVSDDQNLKLAGTLNYRLGIGGFLNDNRVFSQDYKHFNRNSGKLNSFQLTEFYRHSTTAPLYIFGHVEHHFNGLITNKIPLFNRLNWNLVGGSNAFYVNKENNYIELFGGIENILKVLRVDFVAGYEPGKSVRTGIRFMSSGVFGMSSATASKRGNSINLTF